MPQTTRKRASQASGKPYTYRKTGVSARKKSAPKGTRGGMPSTAMIFLAVAVIGLAVAGALLWVRGFYGNTIIRGVFINGLDVSGLTRDEASALFSGDIQAAYDSARVRLTYEDHEWILDAAALGITDNLDETLDQALALGRAGGFSERRAQSREVRKNPVNLTAKAAYDEAAIRSQLAAIGETLENPPQDAVVSFDPSMENEADMFSVRADEAGYAVDADATLAAVKADMEGDWTADVAVSVSLIDAEVTDEYLSQYTHRIAYFGTNIKQKMDDPRTSNIILALSEFNGLVVYPGETVSFNTMTGERTMEKGYQEANQIASDKSLEPALGGGVCQASTTLYNAVMLAGLEVVERNHHSFPSSYVKRGFDATVNWPNKDFIFKNNTDGPIFIKAGVFKDEEGINARVWIFGKPLPDGQYYDRDWTVLEELPAPEPVTKPDENQEYTDKVYYDDEEYVHVSSHGSLKIQTYRVLKDKDGKEISREELYMDHYQEIVGIIYTGIVPASERPPDVNNDGIPDVDSDGDGEVDMLDLDGDRVGDRKWTPPVNDNDDDDDEEDREAEED